MQVEQQLLDTLNSYKRVGQALQTSTTASLLALVAVSNSKQTTGRPDSGASIGSGGERLAEHQFLSSVSHQEGTRANTPLACKRTDQIQEGYCEKYKQSDQTSMGPDRQQEETMAGEETGVLQGQLGLVAEILKQAYMLPMSGDLQHMGHVLQLPVILSGSLGQKQHNEAENMGLDIDRDDKGNEHVAQLKRVLDSLIAKRSVGSDAKHS